MILTKNQIGLLQQTVQDSIKWLATFSQAANVDRSGKIKELQELLVLLEQEDEETG
jgi:hypothetical protein